MGYRSQVRIVLKKNSIEFLKSTDENIARIIESAKINKDYGILTYLGWHQMRGDDIDNLISALSEFSCNEMSYRISILGENMDDIEEHSYTATQDEKLLIPFPYITREFNEKDLENQMQFFVKDLEKNSQEEIEI